MSDIADRYFFSATGRLYDLSKRKGAAAKMPVNAIIYGKPAFTYDTVRNSFTAVEMFPGTGTITGFLPIVESSMISFHRILSDGGACHYRVVHG